MHPKRFPLFRFALSAAATLGVLFPAGAQAETTTTTIPIDPRATYLRTSADDPAPPAGAIDLTALGFQPGDRIFLERLGGFLPGGGFGQAGSMIGVFSSSNELASRDVQHRVPGAIEAGANFATFATLNGGQQTDIPEDFAIAFFGNMGHVVIDIPEGANYLFVTPNDAYFSDNVRVGYALRITVDRDRDGIPDNIDESVRPDRRARVDTGSGPTSVANVMDESGFTIQDHVNQYRASSKNHGQYVSAIAHLANWLAQQGVITGAQKGEFVSGAARSDIGKK